MKLFSSSITTILVTLLTISTALERCQLDEATIKDKNCFIKNKCYNENDARKDADGRVVSKCQICVPSQSQTIWSVKAGFSASIAEPPNDCSSIPTDTYQSCNVPAFEWAAYSTKTTARMYAMKGAVSGNYLFAAGYLKSTIDAAGTASQTAQDFSVSGPFSATDPLGESARTISIDLTSYDAADGAKENAGGSFGQYEVGIVKVDITTGEPEDVFLYYGLGMDEASGLCASDDMLVVSGHFTGKLTAEMMDGSSTTLINSNTKNGVPNQEDQFHPNSRNGAGETGTDDGFVIKASSETGKAKWMVHYPISNKDSQIIGVDMDSAGNVYGSGYKCVQETGPKVCDGVIAKFAAANGKIIWEKTFPDLGAAFWIKYDVSDNALYYTGTTTYGGSSKDAKAHLLCSSDACAVTGRMSAVTGSVEWTRTVPGSPRWGIFDQSGDIELAADNDGPYIYAAFDDVGENGPVTLDAGTSYAGCKNDRTGKIIPEYEVAQDRTVIKSDCPNGTTFVSRNGEDSYPASSANSGVNCGSRGTIDACLMKYHKYTGLPIWAIDLLPISGFVPSPDGTSIMVGGRYVTGRQEVDFDSVTLPGYSREGGLGSQKTGLYNALLSTKKGVGEYVLHSGGGSKDRLFDIVGDASGNFYNIGYSMNLVMSWGGTLTTTMAESDVEESQAGSEAQETHFLVAKIAAANPTVVPSCLYWCRDTTANARVKRDTCFIDGLCYDAGATGKLFGKGCFVCDPAVSKTEWTAGAAIGTTHCFVDDICVEDGVFFWYQRRTWAGKTYSECQYCDAAKNGYDWSVVKGSKAIEGENPPNDCK